MDILAGKLKAGACIYYDNLVLQWLVTALGYERLLAAFGHALHGSLLGLTTALPPKERVDLNEAKDKWVSYWNGSLRWHAMFQLLWQQDVHDCISVATITDWAATCSEEEGVLGGDRVVTTTGTATQCTAQEAVLKDACVVIASSLR